MKAKAAAIFATVWALSGCTGIPENAEPVGNFDLERFQGTWYELARLDHSFERGLSRVTANYSKREDGKIGVLNKGYLADKAKWKQAKGKAVPLSDEGKGHLGVSFFGPFYSSYVVFELGEAYDYAFVAGFNTDYLWLLSRTPELGDELKQRFIEAAGSRGFNTEDLIFVDQSPLPE